MLMPKNFDIDAVEATIDRLHLLFLVKIMDEEQMLTVIDDNMISELIEIFTVSKYDDNFKFKNIKAINMAFDVECWMELPDKALTKRSVKKIITDQYLIPVGAKLANLYNNAELVEKMNRLTQIGIVCLLLEIDQFFSTFRTQESKPFSFNIVVLPSMTDIIEIRNEFFED
ncbi:hypothetical protein IKE07_00435 [Candidatus Saccharibacteria bacterium]|nr:hypothetical protein [Candidatus Saccharibacteria bacterium]